jgi:hypothetical protein
MLTLMACEASFNWNIAFTSERASRAASVRPRFAASWSAVEARIIAHTVSGDSAVSLHILEF